MEDTLLFMFCLGRASVNYYLTLVSYTRHTINFINCKVCPHDLVPLSKFVQRIRKQPKINLIDWVEWIRRYNRFRYIYAIYRPSNLHSLQNNPIRVIIISVLILTDDLNNSWKVNRTVLKNEGDLFYIQANHL